MSTLPQSSSAVDVLVYGGNPSGIAAAVRAAREGCSVLLVNHTHHLGGMMANGLVQWDAQSAQRRCPFFRDLLDRIEDHYRTTYGADSAELAHATLNHHNYPVGKVEPSVVERIFNEMITAEPNITVLLGYFVERVRRRFNRVESVLLREMNGSGRLERLAKVFIDAGYEGDLAAYAGVPYRVGREGFEETGEPHAGRIYTQILNGINGPDPEICERFQFRVYSQVNGGIHPQSPRTGDRCVQAYNLRPCLTCKPENGIPLKSPPPGYDADDYLHYARKNLALYRPEHSINGKATYNNAILPGENWDYPDGDWATRWRIHERHKNFALGLMWYLQNDKSVKPSDQEYFRLWYLAADEHTDNAHLPWEMYVRETRRIVARHVLSEHDLSPQPATDLARPFDDSIAFTDWYMDSHSCDHDATYGDPISAEYPYDGKLILSKELRPGQIPYRSLLPRGLDNLLVPVCLGATHVAWGSVRLEPCLIHTGEVAGFAAAIAVRDGKLPGELDGEDLAREISGRGVEVRYPVGL
jgi:hypothetical protein